MTDQDKINQILTALNQDAPVSNTGKILQQVLINTVPTLQTAQLDQIMQALGLSDD